MIRIVIPGWAMPPALYAALNPDVVFDYGFFPGSIESADASFDVFPLDSTNPSAVMTFAPPKQPYEMVAHSMGALAALARSPLRDNAERVVILGGFAKFAKSSDNPLGVPISDIDAMFEN
ncbi:MAG: hypothetical protein GXP32_03155, partial [Kiritimatiellaeota bacterium]|nr:hypothetical protein [Kiritimatiellota bacterium]